MHSETSAIFPAPAVDPHVVVVPRLENGDRLTRAEFERRYRAMPGVKKAELLEGVVYMPSPVSMRRHGKPHYNLIAWFARFEAATPGVQGADNSTVRLDLDNEPQPDILMLISPECGGRTKFSSEGYVEGGPEFVAEVASSSVSIDLNLKFHVYRRHGVQEYLVWRVLDQKIDWFRSRDGEFVRLEPDSAGILRSEIFPGLWLDEAALLRGDLRQLFAVLDRGLATAEHREFVERLARKAQ